MPRQAQLHAVREAEGNTQKRPIPPTVKLPPGASPEPSWAQPFPLPALAPKAGRKPPAPRSPGRGGSPEERQVYAIARLGWQLEMAHWWAALRAVEESKRLRAEARRCRQIASLVWREIVPILDAQGLLAEVDAGELKDHCVLQARLDQAERDLTLRGTWVEGSHGAAKNPSTTFANQCREKDRAHILDFGLTPGARDRLNPRGGADGEGDDLFD